MSEFMGNFLQVNELCWQKKTFAFICSGSILFLFNLLGIEWANPIICFIILIVLSFYLFNASLQEKFIFSLFSVFLLVILEFISGYFLALLLNTQISFVLNYDYGVLIIVAISKTLLLIFTKLVRIYIKKKSKPQNYNLDVVLILPVVSLFIMYSLLYFDYWIPQTTLHSEIGRAHV